VGQRETATGQKLQPRDRIRVYVLAGQQKYGQNAARLLYPFPDFPDFHTPLPPVGIVCFPFLSECVTVWAKFCLDVVFTIDRDARFAGADANFVAISPTNPHNPFHNPLCTRSVYENVRCLLPDGWLSSSNEMRLQMQFYIFHKKAFYLSTPGPARKRRLQTPGCDSGVWCTVKIYNQVTFKLLKANNRTKSVIIKKIFF